MQPKFQAVYKPGNDEYYDKWHVVEWIYRQDKNPVSKVIERFGDCSGALARQEAGLLQQDYNRTLNKHVG